MYDPEEAAPVEPMKVPSQESPEADQTQVPLEQLEWWHPASKPVSKSGEQNKDSQWSLMNNFLN